MKKIFKFIAASCLMASVLAGCTGKFEEYNTNPFGPTPEQMVGDGANVGALIKNMQQVLACRCLVVWASQVVLVVKN